MIRAFVYCLLALSAMARAESLEPLDALFGLGGPDMFRVESETLGRGFEVMVRLPRDYAETDCDYPVVYLLDGGILFPMLAPYHFMMELDGIAPAAVIVGISYGGLGFANGNLRSTDYTAPAETPEYWGGAERYQAFLRSELLPLIDARYRVDPARRILVGQSLGGQFVMYSALTDPDRFWGRVAVNPALHRNVEYFIEREPAIGSEPARVLIALASEERDRFRAPLERWLAAWGERTSQPLQLRVENLEGQHHASSAPQAYNAGMRWLFPDPAATDCGAIGNPG